jgi:hypothetical protein
MFRYITDLGLSPVSRSRVAVIPKPVPKSWEFGVPGVDRPFAAADYLGRAGRR